LNKIKANAVVKPIRPRAIPVILTTKGRFLDACARRRGEGDPAGPLPDHALKIGLNKNALIGVKARQWESGAQRPDVRFG
jgi:hypothetical protein